jgi:hypothetical protein
MLELTGYPYKYTAMSPVAVNDCYPRTWSEFLDWFSSEETCLGYLERLC